VQELFKVRNRSGFIKALQLLMRQSGGALNLQTIAVESEISRPTALSYLDALVLSHAVIAVRPYHAGGRNEITHQPRCYGFDTGFVCHAKGWDRLRHDDFGILWEHLVLDALLAVFGDDRVFYWRDKAGHEVDFIVTKGRDAVIAIECKHNPDKFQPENLAVFRSLYPHGENWVLSPGIKSASQKRFDTAIVDFIPLKDLEVK
jgi:uncharacterized protein